MQIYWQRTKGHKTQPRFCDSTRKMRAMETGEQGNGNHDAVQQQDAERNRLCWFHGNGCPCRLCPHDHARCATPPVINDGRVGIHKRRQEMLADNGEVRPIDNRFNGNMGSLYDMQAIQRVGRMSPMERISAALPRPQRRYAFQQRRIQFVPATMLAPTVGGHAVARGGRGIDILPQDVTATRTLDVEADDGEDRTDGSELEIEDHPDDGESTCSGRSGIDNSVHM